MLITFLTPMMFQSFIRDIYHSFAIIMSQGKSKYLKIPIIIMGETFCFIFFIFSFGIYYIYLFVYIAYSCCFSENNS